MVWSHWICDTITGQKQLLVSPSAGSWERKLNGVGQGSHTFVVQGHSFGRERWRDLLDTKWNRTLVVCWDDAPVYAGVIASADPQSDGTVTVQHYEIRAMLDRRIPEGTFNITGRSLRGLVYQLFVLAINGPSRRSLPFSFPAFDEAGGEDLILWSYEYRSVEAALTEVQSRLNGPDVDLQPRWSFTGTLEWRIRVGTPLLDGPTFESNVTAPKTDVISLSGRTEGSRVVTKVHAIGKGEEEDMRVGAAEIGGITPAIEVTRDFKTVDDVNLLNSNALQEGELFSSPIVQPQISVPAAKVFPNALPGSTARLLFGGHWWYLDAPMTARCVAYSGDGSEAINLTVQEVPG